MARINFNEKDDKRLIALVIIIIAIAVFYIIGNIIKAKNSKPADVQIDPNKAYYSVKDYNSLEEIFQKYGCRLISKEETEDGILKMMVSFDVGLYTGTKSNESHFTNLSRMIAEFLEYRNFEMVDETRKIDIVINCEKTNISEFIINGDPNYYLNHDSEINSQKQIVKGEKYSIESSQLRQAVESDWDEKAVDWGTRESTCDGYNIYFDEGIKYKTIGKKIFNIVFTTRYEGEIEGGLGVNTTKEEVEKTFGTPKYVSDFEYGYKGEDNYIFFDFLNNEVSIYPIQEISSNDEARLKEIINEMNSSRDIKQFALDLTDLWLDYDLYDYDSNFVDLRYTLKGFQVYISNSSIKNGIFIYQNYTGNRDIKNLENVYIMDTDFVFDEEQARATNEIDALNIDDPGDDDGKIVEERSNIFNVKFKSYSNGEFVGAQFYSLDKQYPDSELERLLGISSYVWYEDDKFVYSVNDDGIYVYNCISRMNVKISDIEGEIVINSVEPGKITYNDTEIIKVTIN